MKNEKRKAQAIMAGVAASPLVLVGGIIGAEKALDKLL